MGHWATFPLIPKLVQLMFEAQGRGRTCIPLDCDREKEKERRGEKDFFSIGLHESDRATLSTLDTVGDVFVYCEQISWSKAESQQIAVRWLLY